MPSGLILLGAPGSGKSTLAPMVADILQASRWPVISRDNEAYWTPEARNKLALEKGYRSADDPDFRKSCGLKIVMDIMDRNAEALKQAGRASVGLLQLPDKPPAIMEKTFQKYWERGIYVPACIVLTFQGSDAEYMEGFRGRFDGRATSKPGQAVLDADKYAEDDLLKRRRLCTEVALQPYARAAALSFDQTPEQSAQQVAALARDLIFQGSGINLRL